MRFGRKTILLHGDVTYEDGRVDATGLGDLVYGIWGGRDLNFYQ